MTKLCPVCNTPDVLPKGHSYVVPVKEQKGFRQFDSVELERKLHKAGFDVRAIVVTTDEEGSVCVAAMYQPVNPSIRTKAEQVGVRLGLKVHGGGSTLTEPKKRIRPTHLHHVESDTIWHLIDNHKHVRATRSTRIAKRESAVNRKET